jgi:hypothetical protein
MEKMKTNKAMRCAMAVLVAVMLSLCGVSGTFAKYTTEASASDSARVAKFGVSVKAEGDLFGKTYVSGESGNIIGKDGDTSLTVVSNSTADDNVVAPGTKNNDGITLTLSGNAETTVNVSIAVANSDENSTSVKDVFLKAKNGLPDYTVYADEQSTYDNTSDYYPILYTLTQETSTEESNTTTPQDAKSEGDNIKTHTYTISEKVRTDIYTGTLSQIEGVLESFSKSSVAPNTDLESKIGTLTLTWAWNIDTADVADSATVEEISAAKTLSNKNDTLLGKLAADESVEGLTAGTDYNLNPSITINVTITQVD